MTTETLTLKPIGRRRVLGALAWGGLFTAMPGVLLAAGRQAFLAGDTAGVLEALFGARQPVESGRIDLRVPEIAENGAVVPLSVRTDLPGVKRIAIVIDANPTPLSASFELLDGALADISTRVKMGASSDVRAIVETDDGVYMATRQVKVTIGGCGG